MSTVGEEAERLYQEWSTLMHRYRTRDTGENSRAEQFAYDQLVDFVEANDLNGSVHDPRGLIGEDS